MFYLPTQLGVPTRLRGAFNYLSKSGQHLFLYGTVLVVKSLHLISGPLVSRAHSSEKHIDQFVLSFNLALMNKAQ